MSGHKSGIYVFLFKEIRSLKIVKERFFAGLSGRRALGVYRKLFENIPSARFLRRETFCRHKKAWRDICGLTEFFAFVEAGFIEKARVSVFLWAAFFRLSTLFAPVGCLFIIRRGRISLSSLKIFSQLRLQKNLFKLFDVLSIILLIFASARDSRKALEDAVFFAFKQIRKKCAGFFPVPSRNEDGLKFYSGEIEKWKN